MWCRLFVLCCVASVYGLEFSPPENGVDRDDAGKDAQSLRAAMKGLGTDEGAIIGILTNRTNAERQVIAKRYYEQFGKQLVKELKAEISGTFRKVVVALMMEPTEYLAKELNDALTAIVPDNQCVVSILCTKTRYELKPILDTYRFLYNKTLMSDIDEISTPNYKMFMRNLLTGKMRDVGGVNRDKVRAQAAYIPTSTDDCGMSTNVRFMEMVAKESFEQLRHVIHTYESMHNISAGSWLHLYCGDKDLEEAYITVLDYAKSPGAYFAKLINSAVIGVGTSDDVLIRTIVTRKEIDLEEIKRVYRSNYNTTLTDAIASETSGDYKRILLALIGYEK